MTQSIVVVATEPGAGKSAICLGLLDQFERHGVRAGFFKPVGLTASAHEVDPDVQLIHASLGISRPLQQATAVDARDVTEGVQSGGYGGVMDRILDAHAHLAQNLDLILCEGVDSMSAFPALESDINVDIARNIDASIVLVTAGEDRCVEQVASNIALARQGLIERGGRVLGTIVNRVNAEDRARFTDTLRWQLKERGITLFGVVPALTALARLRMVDVVTSLQGKVLAGETHLQNEIKGILVAAMSLDNALHYFSDGCLVIAPADREEIVLAAAASHTASDTPRPAGVVLSGHLEPRRRVMQLAHSLSGDKMPIVQVRTPTFETAVDVHHIKPLMTADQDVKMAAIRSAMEEYVDVERLLEERLKPTEKILTPKRFLRELRDKARSSQRTIVLPESDVDRIIKAVGDLRHADAARLILLGDEREVRQRAQTLGVELDAGVVIVDPRTDSQLDDYVQTLLELRKHKGMTEEKARQLMANRTYFGTMMVYKGRAHGMVSGATTTTADTIRPSLEFVKTKPGFSSVSSIFFMCLPDRVLVYGDCAVLPNPTPEQLAEIALASAETARAFGIEPRVAMLSYSTGDSGHGTDVEAVREATRIARERNPQLPVEGPIQYDAAADLEVARTKLPLSPVAGRATVFIFPDLNTGNNTYKAVQRSSGAIAIGPVLQGLNKPVNDLSRGATVVDIVNTVIVTAIQAQ
jgi:phosphate acetyltransferase